MLDFMEYIQRSFSIAAGCNQDNSYAALTDTARALLDFSTPERLRVHLSSLSTPQFATSYTLGTVGLIDGSISYLFSTLPLDNTPSRSNLIPLRHLVPGYRQISAPRPPRSDWDWQDGTIAEDDKYSEGGKANRRKPTLLHASLHLPPPTTLNALFLRRLSPATQLSLSLYSSQAPSPYKSVPQASILTQLFHDTGKYSTEFLFSTDNALIGLRGLWNFGPDCRTARSQTAPKSAESSSPSVSLVSAGGELYYSPLSSVVGLSTGLRFTTLPAANGPSSPSSTATPSTGFQPPSAISTFPYTLTLSLTPLTGSLSTTYSLVASPNLTFSSRFGFNVYSWESEMVAGCELWRRKQSTPDEKPLVNELEPGKEDKASTGSHLFDDSTISPSAVRGPAAQSHSEDGGEVDDSDSVVKLRIDQSWNVRLLWEGRVKDLLVSAGVGLGPSGRSSIYNPPSYSGGGTGETTATRVPYGWTGVGVSVSYSS